MTKAKQGETIFLIFVILNSLGTLNLRKEKNVRNEYLFYNLPFKTNKMFYRE